jgi:dsRNA-specific ribonuclease
VAFNNNNEKNSREKLYHITVTIDGEAYGKGADYSIKGAEQLAAEKTWQMLVEKNMVK